MVMTLEIKLVPGSKRPYHIEQVKFGTYNDVAEVYQWCEQQFGHRNEKYDNPRWYGNTDWLSGNFQFKKRKDANWFLLRWS
jgi:hypothetical protein